MLQQERIADKEEAFRIAVNGLASQMWHAMVAIVESFDVAKGTVKVALAIQATATDDQGNQSYMSIAPLVDVPVIFMGGGGMVATFPINAGDEALIIFADRCIDAWWKNGGIQRQLATRVHSMSDGFALVGPRSLARLIPNLSTSTAQFRSLDGTTYFEIAAGGRANVVAPAGLTVTGPVVINGALTLNGVASGASGAPFAIHGALTATGEVTAAGIPVSTHVHPGVQTGSSDTGAPIA